ncbi:double-strand break repair protein AddB [Magnetospira sp. QH-2]|uniref:double-strand break repair protein AddB n=1 Tax=Magnetospira sp. (strain QH-2) TaxID=1288970 RepID=UPI0003E812C2|nr:double-strand break repair protein AddB [Magnetospira sp. QH-2]CCQ72589.1 putative helicase (addB) [Magnetospira sp. QH-2]
MSEAPSRVLTIGAGRPFVDALAAGLLHQTDGDPAILADSLVLLPTRRACRALRDAFLRQAGGRPLLLPRLRPLGDVDADELALGDDGESLGPAMADLPPAIDPLRRLLLLTRLVQGLEGPEAAPDRSARLAAELARLLDQVQTERLDFARLESLVPDEFAVHWQQTLTFLSILTKTWPSVLEAEGTLDPADRRNRLMAAQLTTWTDHPPAGPVIAAGTTGSVPATADLLAHVAAMDKGLVVLPGLDRTLDEPTWAALDPPHPQYGLKKLLDRLGLERAAVADWPQHEATPQHATPDRQGLIHEALRPATTTEAWRDVTPPDSRLLDGVRRIDCPTPKEEAAIIALHLRESLEAVETGQTAALVTPDRALARRVAAELRRWGVEIDDSAGLPLDQTAPGGFLRLTARMVAEDFAPVALLAALKHPLAAGNQSVGAFRQSVRRMEREGLRGPRPEGGLAGLRAACPESALVIDHMEKNGHSFSSLFDGGAHSLSNLLRAHVALAEALAATDEQPGADRLWAGEAGAALADFVADLDQAADVLEPLAANRYPALLDVLMAGRVVRPQRGQHPRLAILGPLEARLQRADLLIVGGLNEGDWPPETQANPWMSRPMMERFGLPLPERRIGLSAHDFVQCFCAARVVLTRSQRVDGTPTVPSRWLLRLETLLGGGEGESVLHGGLDWLHWQAKLDEPAAFSPGEPPAPKPPVSARPRQLSVTQVETWMRDPYAVYARHILKLRALDPLDADPGMADYGTFIHGALDAFIRRFPPPGSLPEEAEAHLLDLGREAFGSHMNRPGVWAFWWPRFQRIAAWFVTAEQARRDAGLQVSHTEIKGTLVVNGPVYPFTLTATADRLDQLADGSLALIDYKTGTVPSQKEVAAGFAPQLPLEGAIAQAGGFPGKGTVSALEYWALRGSAKEGGKTQAAGKEPAGLIQEALEGLHKLVGTYQFPEAAYPSIPRPDVAPRYSDYEHLARRREWATSDVGDGE